MELSILMLLIKKVMLLLFLALKKKNQLTRKTHYEWSIIHINDKYVKQSTTNNLNSTPFISFTLIP